jgi:hypothetical protein
MALQPNTCKMMCLGCESKLTTKQLQEFYPGDISKVNHIEIRSGSTGELKIFTDKQQVQDWLSGVRKPIVTVL